MAYPLALLGSPDTVTWVWFPTRSSRYPRIMRALPAWSTIGSTHRLSALQVTLALVALPFSSISARGEALLNPLALFQWLLATTPATSVLPMAVPLPTNFTLITPVPDPAIPFTVRVTAVLCIRVPLVAVMVSVLLP